MNPVFNALAAFVALFGDQMGQSENSSGAGSFIRSEDRRVAWVAYRLAQAGAGMCSESAPLTGMQLHQLAEYAPADREAAVQSYHLDRGPGVLTVLPDSSAARAGLQAGDVLLAIDSVPIESPQAVASERDRSGKRDAIEAVEKKLERALGQGSARLALLRAGETLDVTLGSVAACPARVRLARSSQPNAFADGRYAIITTKLLEFVRSDDELAVAIAHELAHNVLEHSTRLRAGKVPRGLLRHFGKNADRVWTTEEEADRTGLKIYAAAGYDLAAVMPFWRRYYAHFDFLPQIFRTHPSLSARQKIYDDVVAEMNGLATPKP
jgi:hypothetical protein